MYEISVRRVQPTNKDVSSILPITKICASYLQDNVTKQLLPGIIMDRHSVHLIIILIISIERLTAGPTSHVQTRNKTILSDLTPNV